MTSKRGAIQLSMSTIIVVILGVVLLVLGLTFVSGIFEKIGGLTDEAFSNAAKELANIGKETNQEYTSTPQNLKITQGEGGFAGAIVKNTNSDGDHTYKVKVGIPPKSAKKSNLECYLTTTEEQESETFTLKSGEFRDFQLTIVDGGDSPLGMYSCAVEFQKDGVLAQNFAIGITIK